VSQPLARAGIVGKQIGWHSFRHSLATNLRTLGLDIKVAQELLRHSSCRTTLDIYTRAVYRAHAVMDQALVDLSNNFRRASFLKGLLQKVECHGGHRGYTGFDRRCIDWREER
jgi:hypothetical protein